MSEEPAPSILKDNERIGKTTPARTLYAADLPADHKSRAMSVPSSREMREQMQRDGKIQGELDDHRAVKSDPLVTPPSADSVKAKAEPVAGQGTVQATAMAAPSPSIDYIAVQQPVGDVMRELTQSLGQRTVVGPNIKGVVRQRHLKGNYDTLMDKLAAEYGLFWFTDGGVAYIEPIEEQKTKIIKLKNTDAAQVAETLSAMGLAKHMSRVQVAPGDGTARVTGPDSFQKLIETLLASLEPAADPQVKIIKYGARVN